MKKFMRGLCAAMAASMVLTGCGNSVCEDFVDAFVNISEKGQACGDDFGTITDSERDEAIDECKEEETFDDCSSDDRKAIADFRECTSDMPTCNANDPEAFQAAYLGCLFSLSAAVSDECFPTTSESIRRKIASMTTSHY
ncbi:hypothetical protein F0U60_41600 [Archangium minus]|uniref:Lipoprotein n=1 Tax=Archangium minus TaxID=83450 RepID=A0ABY9X3C6_9BACT|nr:hypothetical protein F0U60_41600 [Archangium minus]